MNKLISANIDVTKIPKEKLVKGQKGTYLNIDIWINEETDKFGNHASINVQQSKDERDAKAKKVYLGNGKKLFGWDDAAPAKPAPVANEVEDEIPF